MRKESTAHAVLIALCILLIQGCVTPTAEVKPIGPSAIVADTSKSGGRSSATFFYLAEVDGRPTPKDSASASHGASQGAGFNLRVQGVERPVRAGRVKVKLVASVEYGAPIQSLFRRSWLDPVEGVVEVDLKEGGRYRVNGVLDAFRHEVWIEEEASGELAGPKVVAPVDSQAAKEMADAAFTCCNLRYEGDWISDASWARLPFIPAGSRIKVKDFGRHRASVVIDGRPMRIGLDFGRNQQSTEDFVARLVIKDDPRLRIEAYADDVKEAIRSGKAKVGMTKEQIILALGYPRTDKTPSLDASVWLYFASDAVNYGVIWDSEGRVKEIQAAPDVRHLVVYGE